MGSMNKTVNQIWNSLYVASRDMEGIKVKNVKVYPQVRISRLTDKELQYYARKKDYVNVKKKLSSRPNKISPESEYSEYEQSEGIASEDDLDLELQSTFIDDGSAPSVSNEDDNDFLPDINPRSSNEKDKIHKESKLTQTDAIESAVEKKEEEKLPLLSSQNPQRIKIDTN
ncbi:hypothetical protein Avbf_06044, partial [Armadillidium vulgare]